MAKPDPVELLIRRVETAQPVSVGLLASDLRLSFETVQRRVTKLIEAGRLEYGWDGKQIELTDAERRERVIDARVRLHRQATAR